MQPTTTVLALPFGSVGAHAERHPFEFFARFECRGEQLNAIAIDLEAVRQSIDRIATGFAAGQEQVTRSIDRIAPSVAANQEQMTRSIDRIAASQEEIARSVSRLTTGQEQMTREITKLQEMSQYALYKGSEPPAQLATPPARKPAPRSPQAPTALTPARNP